MQKKSHKYELIRVWNRCLPHIPINRRQEQKYVIYTTFHP